MSLPDHMLDPSVTNNGCTHDKPDDSYIIHGLYYCEECYEIMVQEYDLVYGRYYDN